MATRRGRTSDSQIKVINVLLDGEVHSAPDIIERCDVHMTSVYACLRRMVNDGWLERTMIEGTCRREYRVTDAGRRGMHFVMLCAGQVPDDSRSSSPTAERSSS